LELDRSGNFGAVVEWLHSPREPELPDHPSNNANKMHLYFAYIVRTWTYSAVVSQADASSYV